MKFTLEFINGISAVSEDGKVLATFKKTTKTFDRSTSGYYNRHRISKGDTKEHVDNFSFSGMVVEVVRAVKTRLAQAPFNHKSNFEDDDDWAIYNTISTTAAGALWFGNTPKDQIKLIKKATKNGLTFELN